MSYRLEICTLNRAFQALQFDMWRATFNVMSFSADDTEKPFWLQAAYDMHAYMQLAFQFTYSSFSLVYCSSMPLIDGFINPVFYPVVQDITQSFAVFFYL